MIVIAFQKSIMQPIIKKNRIVAPKIISDRMIAICLPEKTVFSVQAGF